ncbi:MAG TPA: hypothetical protein VGR78_15565 [Verrucomicrobiae bacterium]|jgi:hypothetical protein|nr:hypothetical protein [Verrucomicrobiae bacterium]
MANLRLLPVGNLLPLILLSSLSVGAELLVSPGTVNLNRPFVLQATGGFISTTASAPDGKLVIGGAFTSLNGHTSPKLIRLYQNGEVDRSFVSPMNSDGNDVRALAVQPDNRVLVAGLFTQFCGRDLKFLAWLTPERVVDPTFHFRPEPGDLG